METHIKLVRVIPAMNTVIPLHAKSLKLKSHIDNQIILILFLMTLIIAVLGYKSISDLHKTIPFILSISFFGLFIIAKFESKFNIGTLKIFGYIWILKIFLSVSVLFLGWIPDLDTVLITWTGFDPQRYYYQAAFLANSDFKEFTIIDLHQYYVGIIYYYALVMYLFGANPVAPVFMNLFISLLTSLYVIRFMTLLDVNVEKYKTPIFLMLLMFPEVLWYDVMTGRDTFSMYMLTPELSDSTRFDYIRTQEISRFLAFPFLTLWVPMHPSSELSLQKRELFYRHVINPAYSNERLLSL